MAEEEDLNLEDLGAAADTASDVAVSEAPASAEMTEQPEQENTELARTASDLEAVFDIPVSVTAVLGKSRMKVSQLLKLGRGAVVELDRKVGEVMVVEDRLGVTMTEIIKPDRR